MCTGAYFQALLYRYRTEKNPETLKKARRCFQGLKFIFEIGKELETGFFPKTYGGRFSDETSSDQCLYAIYSMDAYYEFASDEEKKEIDFMIPAIADFWRKRKYIYNYWSQKNMQWPVFRFPVFMLLAYKHSEEKKFIDEYRRILSSWDMEYPHQFNLLGLKQRGKIKPNELEKKYNAWIVSSMPDYLAMRMMELEYMLLNDPENSLAGRWKKSAMDMWRQAALTLAPDGMAYHMVFVDMDTGKVTRPPPIHESPRASVTGWSTMIARGGVQVLRFCPHDTKIKETVLNILELIDTDTMIYYGEPDRFPPEERFKTRFLSGDSITNWLWAYWQGVFQRLW
jgi:hypothetical protein